VVARREPLTSPRIATVPLHLAQRLDPKTAACRPSLEIYHSHSARRSLLNAEVIPLELHVAPGRLVFHLGEITGNIWMVEWKTR
jgi:hypothetical protein